MLLETISNSWKSVSSDNNNYYPNILKLVKKKLQPTSQSLDIWWNTLLTNLWSITGFMQSWESLAYPSQKSHLDYNNNYYYYYELWGIQICNLIFPASLQEYVFLSFFFFKELLACLWNTVVIIWIEAIILCTDCFIIIAFNSAEDWEVAIEIDSLYSWEPT